MTSDVLSCTAAGAVYGNISVRVNGLSFPDAHWTDFVVIVLNWWCQAVLRLVRGEKGPVEVRYMEGPFLVEISAPASEVWHMALVNAGLTRRVLHRTDIEASSLVSSILEASDRTIATCRRQSWSSTDLDELVAAVGSLRKEVKRASV